MVKNAEALRKLIENGLKEIPLSEEPVNLYEPIKYILEIGGKRLRPLLTMMSYQLFNDDASKIINQALAVEVFHNFTIMHDDIMDKAPLRRSSKTVHTKWNTNIAILSGDVMMVKAYELINTDKGNLYNILKAFNKCAVEVCEGQQYDMDFESRDDVSEAQYIKMITLKTAVLLGFSLQLGALLADHEEEADNLYNVGLNMGIGFQLMDDYLDAFGDPDKFGKQVGGDIIAGKKTYLTIKAYQLANITQIESLNSVYQKKSKLSDIEKVNVVKGIYSDLDIESIIKSKMREYFDEAFKHLWEVDAPLNRKSILRNYFEVLVGREH